MPSCVSRDAATAVTCPNVPVPNVVPIFVNCVWLNALYQSACSSRIFFSVTLIRLISDALKLFTPGVRTERAEVVAMLFAGGAVKQFVSKYRNNVR